MYKAADMQPSAAASTEKTRDGDEQPAFALH
jgi:hypothetical protein